MTNSPRSGATGSGAGPRKPFRRLIEFFFFQKKKQKAIVLLRRNDQLSAKRSHGVWGWPQKAIYLIEFFLFQSSPRSGATGSGAGPRKCCHALMLSNGRRAGGRSRSATIPWAASEFARSSWVSNGCFANGVPALYVFTRKRPPVVVEPPPRRPYCPPCDTDCTSHT
jgi:hypothetical protein